MRGLRLGEFDVLVGVNLLREGLDLPEVSLVAILDADKEGFLRSERSLTQTAGRAARNVKARVIMYADKITDSMKKTIEETLRRREKQLKYNEVHGITPKQIIRSIQSILGQTAVADAKAAEPKAYIEKEGIDIAADPLVQYMNKDQIEKAIARSERQMKAAVKELDFIEAARFRDEIFALKELLNIKK